MRAAGWLIRYGQTLVRQADVFTGSPLRDEGVISRWMAMTQP